MSVTITIKKSFGVLGALGIMCIFTYPSIHPLLTPDIPPSEAFSFINTSFTHQEHAEFLTNNTKYETPQILYCLTKFHPSIFLTAISLWGHRVTRICPRYCWANVGYTLNRATQSLQQTLTHSHQGTLMLCSHRTWYMSQIQLARPSFPMQQIHCLLPVKTFL